MKPETFIQIEVVKWFRQKYPGVLHTCSQIISMRAMMMAKRMGYTSGTPDLMIFTARGGWHGLLVELKTDRGVLSEVQKHWMSVMGDEGYAYEVAYGLDQAKDVIERYMLCL